MTKRPLPQLQLRLDAIVGGGQTIGTCDDGRKMFVWGGLPGETVEAQVTRKKSHFLEGYVTQVLAPSPERISPRDPDSYLSTSPWQIMKFDTEQHHKAALIDEAFSLHRVMLPGETTIYTDGVEYGYRNKVEFSWYSDTDAISGVDTLDLAFFRRGSKGKITIDECALLPESILRIAHEIRDFLRTEHVEARQLKTLLIRCDQSGNCVWQLYIKTPICDFLSEKDCANFSAQGGEVIYSDPRSPASRITERLLATGNIVLSDTVLGVPFRYATEGFFQINLPVYEHALGAMKKWIPADKPIVDLYSGVGSIGLTIGGPGCTLVEISEDAVREMRRNITELDSDASAVLAASENALDYITSDKIIIVDPPRAGLHQDVVDRLLDTMPERIIYLSCNPVTQARDVMILAQAYTIAAHQGYNFFPRTPHIEHLVILDKKPLA